MIKFNRKKEEELLVSNEEVKEEVKNIEKIAKDDADDEPSWYHYVIILGGILGFFALLIFSFSFYYDDSNIENSTSYYIYDYNEGNISYKIHFNSPVSEIEEFEYIIEPDRLDVLNTVTFKISLMNYSGDANIHVGKSSAKLLSFLKRVYHYNIAVEDVVRFNEFNCMNSTKRDKVITFDVNASKTGVFFDDSTGCVEFLTNDSKEIPSLVDKFIYTLIQEEIEYDNR